MVCKYEDQDYDDEEDKKCEYLVKAFSPKVLIRQYNHANSAVRNHPDEEDDDEQEEKDLVKVFSSKVLVKQYNFIRCFDFLMIMRFVVHAMHCMMRIKMMMMRRRIRNTRTLSRPLVPREC